MTERFDVYGGVDGIDIVETLHGLADFAALLACRRWEYSPAGQATAGLASALEQVLMPMVRAGGDAAPWMAVVALQGAVYEAAEDAGRFAFALALTSDDAALGWEAWMLAARTLLGRAGCDPLAHQEATRAYLVEQAGRLRPPAPAPPAAT